MYYLTIETEQTKERSRLQCLKRNLMLQECVVECISPGHIRMAGCVRMLFAALEGDYPQGVSWRHFPGSFCKPRFFCAWIPMARVVRAETLKLKQMEYVQAARALGASETKIALSHVLPNISGIVIVRAMFSIPSSIFFER